MHWLDDAFVAYVRQRSRGSVDDAAGILQWACACGNADYVQQLCKLADEEPGCAVAELYTAKQATVIFDGFVWACEHNEPEGDQ